MLGMMKDDKKKIAGLILGVKMDKNGNDGQMEEKKSEDSSSMKKMAAEEVMAALKNNDVEQFSSALEAFINCCDDSEMETEQETED